MLKQRRHLNPENSYRSIVKAAFKNEGRMSFWRSFPISFVSNVPNSMIIVSSNEAIKTMLRTKIDKLEIYHYFISAACSGAISSLLTTPIDNIKTRLNVQLSKVERLNILRNSNQGNHILRSENENALFPHPKRTYIKGLNYNACPCNPYSVKSSKVKYPNSLCAISIIFKEEVVIHII